MQGKKWVHCKLCDPGQEFPTVGLLRKHQHAAHAERYSILHSPTPAANLSARAEEMDIASLPLRQMIHRAGAFIGNSANGATAPNITVADLLDGLKKDRQALDDIIGIIQGAAQLDLRMKTNEAKTSSQEKAAAE